MTKPTVISENTKITFGALAIVVGGVAWLTNMNFQITASAKAQDEMSAKIDKIESLSTDVAVIKSEVREIHKKLDKMDTGP